MDRFNSKWKEDKETGCHIWTACQRRGYGAFTYKKTLVSAHRVAWMLANGNIPEGKFVCHACDTPLCVNPEHLFLGTHTDNMQDKVKKGRLVTQMVNGDNHPNAKLTCSKVLEIIKLLEKGMSNADIAKRYNVHRRTISHVKTGYSWNHITNFKNKGTN